MPDADDGRRDVSVPEARPKSYTLLVMLVLAGVVVIVLLLMFFPGGSNVAPEPVDTSAGTPEIPAGAGE
jgi:hypothetical protein